MENKYNIIPIFPIPVLETPMPDIYSNVLDLFYNEPLRKLPPESQLKFGDRSDNSYILDDPKYTDFSNYILSLVKEYGNNVLGFDYDIYKFSQSWISIKKPQEEHIIHTHPNSLISGVFYFGEFNPNTPSIIFHKTTNNHIFSPKTSDKLSKYNAKEFPVTPFPGLLLLFPSTLQHSVPLNTSNTNRYSLAFNVFSPEGLGSEENLTELKFN